MILKPGHRSAIALAFALLAVSGSSAQAQYYPGGYGNYGWGGWGGGGGGTVAGNAARGLGAFAAGAGQYNVDTAQANAINTDTAMKWNEYVYSSTVAASKREHARLAGRQANTEAARQAILTRLRENPEQRDIESGAALNLVKQDIDNPNIYVRTLKAAKAKISGKEIRDIPFQYASAGISTSIHDLVAGGPPPVLKDPKFDSDRAAIKEVAATVRADIEEGKQPKAEDLQKIREMVKAARTKLEAEVPRTDKGFLEAQKYLKSIAGLTRMLEGPSMSTILPGENHKESALGDLLEFMNAYSLRFGPAKTESQKATYMKLYGQLSAIRKEVAPPTTEVAAPNHEHAQNFFAGMNAKDVENTPPPPKPPAPK